MLRHTDNEAANDVDEQDHDPCHRIPFDEFGGTIHRTVKIGLRRHILTPPFSFILVNQAGIEIRIYRHLLTWHSVQGKTGTHLRNTPSPFGHDNKVDDHQNDKNDQTHCIVAAYHHVAECLDNMTRSTWPIMPLQQHHAGRRDVQRQA